MLVGLKKEVTNVVVGHATQEEWKTYLERKITCARPSKAASTRRYKKPSKTGLVYECHERITWTKEFPIILHDNNWQSIDWESNGFTYRAFLTLFTISRNSFNGIVKVEFEYTTERECPFLKKWVLV